MKIYREADYEAMSARAAGIIAAEVKNDSGCVLGLATGSTPIGTYKGLVEMVNNGEISFKNVRTVNLDEYVGLAPTHDQSYRYFMNENLFDHVDIDKNNTAVPNGLADDIDAECRRYEEHIASLGGTALQLLGLGRNGHIGFNEPGDVFVKDTHQVELTQSTIDANARFFATMDDVPRKAVTMGVGAIMNAKTVLMVVSGSDKAQAVYDLVCGPIDPKCPASILQLHKDFILVADEAAASKLSDAGYVFEN